MDDLEAQLAQTSAELANLEAIDATRRRALEQARALLERVRRHRQRGHVPVWEAAQRSGARIVMLALGCGLLISGASALDDGLGGAAMVLSFGLLGFEGAR